jgi:antitoxin (DNA-binding transcriptional repressor) of toxin-antitoxin stability system
MLMSLTISLEEAQATLADLIDKLGPGEEVVITKGAQPVAELRSLTTGKPQPRFGSCKGMLTIVTDDEEHLEDFTEYMP